MILLAGCGGGGADSNALVVTYPSSGSYAWLTPIGGTSAALKMGISLIHPSDKTVQYAIEPTSSAIADVKVVKSGTVDVATKTVSNIKPDSLLYIVNGEVRRLLLTANGIAPASRVRKTGNINACKFTIDANDYTNPDQSKFIVSLKGADASCGTADDGQMEITLAANGGVAAGVPLQKVLGVLGDFGTLAPSGWVLGSGILWSGGPLAIMRVNSDPNITRVVDANYKAIVAEYNNQLTMWKITGNQLATETKLNLATTLGVNWQSIGYDANSFYVYQNSSNPLSVCTTASAWKILKIDIVAPTATLLASGSGCIGSASMGVSVLYASVLGATTTTNALVRVDKATGAKLAVQSGTLSDLFTVLTSSAGIHQMLLATNLNVAPVFAVKMVDEAGAVWYSLNSGFPMGLQDAATVNLNNSENRTRFFAATSYLSGVAYKDTNIELYDASTHAVTTLGSFAGFWSGALNANVVGSTENFVAGTATPISAGAMLESSAKTFSLDLTTANSMTATTVKR